MHTLELLSWFHQVKEFHQSIVIQGIQRIGALDGKLDLAFNQYQAKTCAPVWAKVLQKIAPVSLMFNMEKGIPRSIKQSRSESIFSNKKIRPYSV